MVKHGEHGTRLLPAAIAAAIALGALTVAGAFLPHATTWGFHFLAFLPTSYLAAYVVLFVAVILLSLLADVDRVISGVAGFAGRRPAVFLSLCVAGFAAFAWTFRVDAPLLGDGFFLVRNFSEAARGVAPLYYRNEPLATLLYSIALKNFGIATFSEFLRSFLRAEIVFGAATMVSLFFTVRLLVRTNEDRLLSFVFVLAFPSMQLFFGYIEVYAAVVCAVSFYLLSVALHLTGKLPFRYLPLCFLAMALTHYGTLLLAPALVYLAYREYGRKGIREVAMGAGISGAVALALLVAVGFNTEQFSSWVPHSHFLPIARSGDPSEAYTSAFTLFSVYHVVDVANLALLVAPSALLLIAFTLLRNIRTLLESSLHTFFLITLAPAMGLLLVIKYDLGGARDWDVFTFVFFVLSLYGAIVFSSSEASGKRRITLLLTGVTFLNSYLFFAVNSQPVASETRFTSLFDRRMMSHAGFYSGSLYLSQYYHQVKNTAGPIAVWKRYLGEFPEDERGYKNVLTNAGRTNALSEDETLGLFESWVAVAPETSSARGAYAAYCIERGKWYAESRDYRRAERFLAKGVEADSASAEARNALGAVLVRLGGEEEALRHFQRAALLDEEYSEPMWNIGNVYLRNGERERGMTHLRRAARLGHQKAASRVLELEKGPRTNHISITEKD